MTVDRAAAIGSSINFPGSFSSGKKSEAGMVSIRENVVESIVDYVLNLLEK
jgi:hypothetical protein